MTNYANITAKPIRFPITVPLDLSQFEFDTLYPDQPELDQVEVEKQRFENALARWYRFRNAKYVLTND